MCITEERKGIMFYGADVWRLKGLRTGMKITTRLIYSKK
jgi:hypothetical protein